MKKNVRIIGTPLDLGQSHRGVNMCPGALRYADLADRLRQIGYQATDMGNVDIRIRIKKDALTSFCLMLRCQYEDNNFNRR